MNIALVTEFDSECFLAHFENEIGVSWFNNPLA